MIRDPRSEIPSSARRGFSLMEVVRASALLVALCLPLSALTVQSTRTVHHGRYRLALEARARYHQDLLRKRSFEDLEDLRGLEGPQPLERLEGPEEELDPGLPEDLLEECEVREVRPGLLRITTRLQWTVDTSKIPRVLEVHQLRARPTLALEARLIRSGAIS